MIFFKNETIEIWKNKKTTEYDPYTDEYLEEYQLIKTIPADFQNLSPKEEELEYGEILQDKYKIYTNEKIPKNTLIRIKGKKETYTIEGSTQYNNHFKKTTHYKTILIKEREIRELKKEKI